VSAFARAGDVLFAISTSGNSPNIVRAAEVARAAGCEVVAFTGAGGGKLARVASTMVAVPSKRVARVQEIHGICLHAIASALEEGVDFGATDASA
jgi:D-sedoheptulose 7-phosphate isomerase